MDIKLLVSKVEDLEHRLKKLEELTLEKKKIDVTDDSIKKVSIKEFILLKKPSSDVLKTLTISYYLEKNECMNSFNVDDLNRYFQLAKEPAPQNLNDQINKNIRKGHIMEAEEKKGNKKSWVMTNSGEQFVENNFKEKNEQT